MKKWLFSMVGVCASFPLFAGVIDHTRKLQIQQCLLEHYRIDPAAAGQILDKFSPLLENEAQAFVLDTFIEISERLNIYSEGGIPIANVPSPDHSVLFENTHLRVSWAVTKSGEQEPFQIHPLQTLMVIVRPSQFYSQQENGIGYEDNWPVGVYFLDPCFEPMSCKNIGPEDYCGLIFEIKVLFASP